MTGIDRFSALYPWWRDAANGHSLERQWARLVAELRARDVSPATINLIGEHTLAGALLRPHPDGRSRGGGGYAPLVDPDWVWPSTGYGPQALVAEISLGDIVGVEQLNLPVRGGTLLFFRDETPGLEVLSPAYTHVTYRPDGAVGIPAEGRGEFQSPDCCPMGAFAAPLVESNDDLTDELFNAQNADLGDVLWEVYGYQTFSWRFLGTSDSQPPMQARIQEWFLDPESEDDHPRFTPSERKGAGWRNLLQVRGCGEEGNLRFWPEHDGTICFCIPEVDLAAWRFDRVISYWSPR